MLRRVHWLGTDVSGLGIGLNFKGQGTERPETSVPNQPTLRIIAEDGIIQL